MPRKNALPQAKSSMVTGSLGITQSSGLDKQAVIDAAKTGRVVAAQDHNLLGGLGQLVGSCIAEAGIACKLVSRGCPDYFVPIANPEFLYARNGMDADGLYEAMKAMF